MQKKRIMINTFALRGGGGQTHLLKIMEYLEDARNFSVILLVSSFSGGGLLVGFFGLLLWIFKKTKYGFIVVAPAPNKVA